MKHEADLAESPVATTGFGKCGQCGSGEFDTALAGLKDPTAQVQEGRLAGPARSDAGRPFAGSEREVFDLELEPVVSGSTARELNAPEADRGF